MDNPTTARAEGTDVKAPGVHNGRNDQRAPSTGSRVTIKDIARRAGVSKTAVSFAFNVPGRLSARTTQRILDVARELGYMPNPIARSLNTRRTNALGLLVPQDISDLLANPFFTALLSGIGSVCKREGLSLMIVPPRRGSLVDATYAALVDGCIVTGLDADDDAVKALRQRNIPFVMMDTDAPDGVACVNIEDAAGARLAMRHLLELGHRAITVVAFESYFGVPEKYTGTLKHRFDGVRAALVEHGLSPRDPRITTFEAPCSAEGGAQALERVLALRPVPTAVLTLSDAIAHGMIEAAISRGLQVPRDLSVIGYDGVEVWGRTSPTLTTVRQPAREKGRLATDMLMTLLRGETLARPRVSLPIELIVGQSTGQPARHA
ncbi:MAG: LacI family transcriptional regulator [Thermoflexales bacterium]|nr:LacI family transcriptional regulator [Thermoflexales bacterium]